MINREMPMCQAVLENMQLLPLFPRFQMKLGFGEMTVEEVCKAHEVNPDFSGDRFAHLQARCPPHVISGPAVRAVGLQEAEAA